MDQPLNVLCELGGWKTAKTVLQCYEQADEAQLRKALESRPKGSLLSPVGGNQMSHVVRNPIEAAYRRTDLFERRRQLMDTTWLARLENGRPRRGWLPLLQSQGYDPDFAIRRAGMVAGTMEEHIAVLCGDCPDLGDILLQLLVRRWMSRREHLCGH